MKDFYFEDLESSVELNRMLEEVSLNAGRIYSKAKEREIVTRIEEIEGRVPSDDEIRAFGRAVIMDSDKNWTHYSWRGKPLFSISVPRFETEGNKTLLKWDIKS